MKLVVKIGGTIIDGDLTNLAADTKKNSEKHSIAYVHGGAKIVSEISKKMGKEPEFIVSPSGSRSRYTDEETIKIYEMAMAGSANKKIVKAFLSAGIPAVGLSGLDGKLLVAQRKKKLKVVRNGKIFLIEGGYTGKIVEVNPKLLEILMNGGYMPIIASLALGKEWEALNVDADRAAANVAGGLKADTLLLLTDVPGVLDENKKTIKELTYEEAKQMRKNVGFGMEKKLLAAVEALEAGVSQVIISSGTVEEPITKALDKIGCTVISK
ncbi:MAG: [LysW]-aminoadipate/[LysW]-glutamate kinase [Candidatus Odinarchaeia archaeon]